jgi:hypothetical protein
MINQKFFKYTVIILLAIFLYGCASSGSGGDRERRDRNLISETEIESVNATNMYDVIDRLRPGWLRARAPVRSLVGETDIVVFQDHVQLGSLDVLRQISPNMIKSAQFLDASTAQSTLPGISRGQHIAGAIVLTSVTRH